MSDGHFVPLDVAVDSKSRTPETCTDKPDVKLTIGLIVALGTLSVILLMVVGTGSSAPSTPQMTDLIDSTRLQAHLKFLGSSLLGGRAPGSNGEYVAAAYIKAQMEIMGLNPYIQPVPLEGVKVDAPSISQLVFTGASSLSLNYFADYVTTTDQADFSRGPIQLQNAQVVFVGYGISAPELNWDDYKGVDLTGKVAVVLVNQPPTLTPASGELLYQGRWTYKYEEMRRRKAAACLLVHTNATAGYPYTVVQASNSGELFRAAVPVENAMILRGWMSSASSDSLAKLAGSSLQAWFTAADSRDFKPVSLGVTASHTASYYSRQFNGTNVVGVIEARGANANESVIFMGHLDHLGTKNGTIYPGYLDNASGASMTLTTAFAYAQWVKTNKIQLKRSVVFLCPTAEESGLIGSDYYAKNPDPRYPTSKTVAAIAFDVGNAWGATKNLVVLGWRKSTLGQLFEAHAARFRMWLVDDASPSQGMFFRSDHFSFAKLGVPSVWVTEGPDFVGQPPDYYQTAVQQGYVQQRYHQPGDAYDPNYVYDGMIQEMQVGASAGWALATDTTIKPACINKCL